MKPKPYPRITKTRLVFLVPDLAQSIPFWTDRLGFETIFHSTTHGAPEFVVLHKDGVEIVIQTRESGRQDGSALEPASIESGTVLYLEVDSLPKALARLGGAEVVMPLRRTGYGAAEIAVRLPGGHIVCFSQMNHRASTDTP